MSDHDVISITGAKTKHGSPMWRCTTHAGVTFFVFPEGNGKPGTLHLFGDYANDIRRLGDGESLRWTKHPIVVELIKNGDFWNVASVSPRPAGAVPDANFMPDPALSRQSAIAWAQMVLEGTIVSPQGNTVVWDIETTGTDKLNDEIVSISAVRVADRRILIDQVICPRNLQRLVESGAGEVNGFTPESLAGAPSFNEVYDQIADALVGQAWLTYGAEFDTTVLERECLRNNQLPIPSMGVSCAMEWYARWNGAWDAARQSYSFQKLTEAAQGFGLDTRTAHDALGDVGITLQVIERMAHSG